MAFARKPPQDRSCAINDLVLPARNVAAGVALSIALFALSPDAGAQQSKPAGEESGTGAPPRVTEQTSISLPAADQRVSCLEQLGSGNAAEAIASASVSLSRSSVTSDPSRRFEQLVCRAQAYELQASGDAAEKDYREALRIAAKHFEAFDLRLVDPLTQLGRLRLAAQDDEQAELLLLRARDITHRTAGIYNVEQQAVLDDLTAVFARQGRKQQAHRQQELRLKAARETYGDTPELVESLHDYARYNATEKRFARVRTSLEDAVSILQSEYGVNDPRLIDTLKLRAELYKLHPTISTPKAGEMALQRVVDIYESQEFVDQVDLLNARTDMGDWYLQGLQKGKALRYYKKTVKQALKENTDPALVDKLYGVPKLIFFERTKASVFGLDERGDPMPSGIVRVRYDIKANGRTRNMRFVEDTVNSPALNDLIYWRVKNAMFRPRFVNGKAVVTADVEQSFDVTQSGAGWLTITRFLAPTWSGGEATDR